MSKTKLVDKLESKFLSWVTVAAIFLASGLVLLAFRIVYSIAFLLISIVLQMVIIYDYIIERRKLNLLGIGVNERMDYLYMVIGATIIIQIFIVLDVVTRATSPDQVNDI